MHFGVLDEMPLCARLDRERYSVVLPSKCSSVSSALVA